MAVAKPSGLPHLTRDELKEFYARDPEGFRRLVLQFEEYQVQLARQDINAFVQYVMKDEHFGSYLRQEPQHVELQRFIDEYQFTLIWGGVGIGKCVLDSTTFHTPNGTTVPALQLAKLHAEAEVAKEPLHILTVDPETFALKPTRVKRVTYNGVHETVLVQAASGHTTTVTEHHPFWTLRHPFYGVETGKPEWVSAQALVCAGGGGHDDVVVAAPPVTLPRTYDEQEAFDLGFVHALMPRRWGYTPYTKEKELARAVVIAPDGVNTGVIRDPDIVWETLNEIGWRRGFYAVPSTTRRSAVLYGAWDWLEKNGCVVRKKSLWAVTDRGLPSETRRHEYRTKVTIRRDFSPGAASAHYASGVLAALMTEGPRGDKPLGVIYPHGQTYSPLSNILAAACNAAGVFARVVPVKQAEFYDEDKVRIGTAYPCYVEGRGLPRLVETAIACAPAYAERLRGYLVQLRDDFSTKVPDERVSPERWIPRDDHREVDLSPVTYTAPAGKQRTWAVETEDQTHLTDGILTHNTQQVTVARTLFSLGHNPNMRILIVMSKAELAKDAIQQIRVMIEESPRLHKVFPHLKKGDLWASNEFRVVRTVPTLTPSVRGIGAQTKIDGSRYDLIILDDVLSYDSTQTEAKREETLRWIQSVPLSRQEDWTKVVFIGNAWHHADAMHRFEKMAGWHSKRFPVRDPVTKKSLMPKRWPDDRIARWEASRTPAEARRTLDCVPFSNESSRFRTDWFDTALARGVNIHRDSAGTPIHFLERYDLETEQTKVSKARDLLLAKDPNAALTALPMPVSIFTGVDLGFGMTENSDLSVMFTAVVFDNADVQVLNINKGRWSPPEIIQAIVDTHYAYGSDVFVEAVFTQRFVYDILHAEHKELPIYPWDTKGKGTIGNKWHAIFGVESVAVDISKGRWIIPCVELETPKGKEREIHSAVREFIDACLHYVPDATIHTDDALMAAWIMLQGARTRGSHEYLAALVEVGGYYAAERGFPDRDFNGGIDTSAMWEELREMHLTQQDYSDG